MADPRSFSKLITTSFKRYYKILILITAIVVFFVSYNIFLVDHSLNNLKFSLEGISSADTVLGTQDFGLLLDYNIIREISSTKMNSVDLASIEFSKRVLTQGEWSRKVEDIKFALEQVVNERVGKRGVFLSYLDDFVTTVNKVADKVFYLPARIMGPRLKPGIPTNIFMLEEARSLEESWKLEQALALYQKFLKGNPMYEKRLSVLLKIGHLYQKLSRPIEAEKIYRRVASEGYGSYDAQIAKRLLVRLGRTRKLLIKRKNLLSDISQGLIPPEELQDFYLQLASMNMELFDFDGAQRMLQKVQELDPSTEEALQAKFVLAWLDKYRGELAKAAQGFEEIIKLPGAGELVLSGHIELADLYKKKGELRRSAEKLEEIAEEFKVKPLAPLAQYEAGSTYLYDIKDTEAAVVAFRKLKEEFPTSIYTIEGLKSLKELKQAAEALLIDYQPIILSWIEKTVPAFSAALIPQVRAAADSLIEEEEGSFVLTYTDKQLLDLVNHWFGEAIPRQVHDLNFAINEEGIEVKGSLRLRLLGFEGSCLVKPVVQAGSLVLYVGKAEIADMKIPVSLVGQSLELINRAFSKENLTITIDRIKLEKGLLTIEGSTL